LVAVDLFWGALNTAIYLVFVILAMKRTGQNLGSIGITGVDKWRNLALGLVLSAIYVGVMSLGSTFAGFSASLVYAFILMAIVGFGQEVMWRGYVQTRLTAKIGTIKGLVATALLFALWHFPMRYFQYSGVPLEVLANIFVDLFPMSLLFGYIMYRCQNIIPLSVLHLFVNFSSFLWGLPA
jgi:membrane protease YdiL (CAAX protease family)